MKFADRTFASPEENLACDEVLLDLCEDGAGEEILRFWEPKDYFVVLGYSNPAGTEARLGRCAEDGIPVLRRCSGGGTVLQGPRCLNYSLILSVSSRPELKRLGDSNQGIMERNRRALEELAGKPVAVQGVTDLTLGGRKFSGNAQRRRRNSLLFHGTVLFDFDFARVGRYLNHPSKEPDYRGRRDHGDFLAPFPSSAEAVKGALRRAWQADSPADPVPEDALKKLVQDRYSRKEWNLKF
jgi:lipoate-protein ligase A